MELAIILSVAVLVLALTIAVLASSIPWMFFKLLKQDIKLEQVTKDLEQLDEVMSELLQVSGLERGNLRPQVSANGKPEPSVVDRPRGTGPMNMVE